MLGKILVKPRGTHSSESKVKYSKSRVKQNAVFMKFHYIRQDTLKLGTVPIKILNFFFINRDLL